jgi:nucleoside-diphosphate-sugar epimerase
MLENMVQGKKILVTGASGQCGRGFVHILAKKNDVHGVARFLKPEIKQEVERTGCKVWQMDMGVMRPNGLPTDFDLVLHEASAWGKEDTLEDQNRSFHVSCQFVADLMHRNETAKFALVSTGSVYRMAEGTCKEDETPVAGPDTYTMEKIAMTQMAQWMGHTFGRPWVVLRYFYPFAPYLPHPRVDKLLRGHVQGGNPSALLERLLRTRIENKFSMFSGGYSKQV